MRTAVALAKEAHSSVLRPALGNLAALLLEETRTMGKDAALDEALQLTTWALDYLSHGDPDRVLVFATRGSILASRFDRSGRPQDLEEAISSLQSATGTWSGPDDGEFLAVVSNNLACVLGKRYESTGRREDLHNAITGVLEATKMVSSDHLPLMPGMSSNLASLLARQYESTGMLDCLANALFELRIVAELAPEFPELDALLRELGGLAKGQLALRAQTTVENRGVSQSTYSTSLALFVLVLLSPVLTGVIPWTFYPLVMFMGGIAYNWASQEYTRLTSSNGEPVCVLHSVPAWIQKILSSRYNTSRFAPKLFSTPWIDFRPEDALLTREKLGSQTLTCSTLFESEHREVQGMKTRTKSSIRDKYHKQDHMNASRRGIDQIHRVSLSDPSPTFTTSPETKGCDPETTSLKQLPYDHLADPGVWGNIADSPVDGACLETPLSAFGEGEANGILKKDNCVSEISEEQISESEYAKHMDVAHFTEAAEIWENEDVISNRVHGSQQLVTKASDQEDSEPGSIKQEIPHHQDENEKFKQQENALPARPGPFEAKQEALATSNPTHPSHQDTQPSRDAHRTSGEEFINQEVHSLMSPKSIDKQSSGFDSLTQGNTANDINKNEGTAMGNIYSGETHVVGRLSRHYGDRFETKNISALLSGYQDSEAKQQAPDATPKESLTEDILQEVIDEYIRGNQERVQNKKPKDQSPPGGGVGAGSNPFKGFMFRDEDDIFRNFAKSSGGMNDFEDGLSSMSSAGMPAEIDPRRQRSSRSPLRYRDYEPPERGSSSLRRSHRSLSKHVTSHREGSYEDLVPRAKVPSMPTDPTASGIKPSHPLIPKPPPMPVRSTTRPYPFREVESVARPRNKEVNYREIFPRQILTRRSDGSGEYTDAESTHSDRADNGEGRPDLPETPNDSDSSDSGTSMVYMRMKHPSTPRRIPEDRE